MSHGQAKNSHEIKHVLTQDTGHQSNKDASKDFPAFFFSSFKGKSDNECAETNDQNRCHDNTLVQSEHELFLPGTVLAPDSKVSEHGCNDSSSGNPERKQDLSFVTTGNGHSRNDRSDLPHETKIVKIHVRVCSVCFSTSTRHQAKPRKYVQMTRTSRLPCPPHLRPER